MVSHRIALAGRIAVQDGDTTIDERALPGRQLRLVFVMLVIERHRPVLREELSDNLWPNCRPDTWDTALRGVVSRVRGFVVASGLGSRERLRVQAGGYRLELEGVEVDLERASAASEGAGSALASGDLEQAAHLATQARAVLARPLLAGIDAPWVEARRRELALELLHALEVLAQARLGLGQQAGAVAAARAAIALDPFRESPYRVLMGAGIIAGDPIPGLQAYERLRRLLSTELGVDPSRQTQALHRRLLSDTEFPDPRSATWPPRGSTGIAPAEAPYLGLQTFDEADSARFFGRSADVSRLLDRLGVTRFLAVVGASGSGKSSLVRAGLVPALRGGALPGSDTWMIRVLRPGAVPLQALADAILELDPRSTADTTLRRIASDRHALHDLVEDALDGGTEADRVLLVIDQLEEVFTLCTDPNQRESFLESLTAAATRSNGRLVVVMTLRADFYPRLADHPQLWDLTSACQLLVTPMDEVGLGAAVKGPAHAAGLTLEAGLTETILRDVARRPGALPLLGHALLELWRRRSATTLTLGDYHATGGVEGALTQRAEAIYANLSAEEQAVARRVLLRLIQPGQASGDTRRRVPISELATRPQDQAAGERVVDTLTAARLLTVGGSADGAPHVEISHEALIQSWPRLRHWIEEDRAGLVAHRRLTEAATEWEQLGRDDGALFRGAQLAMAVAWTERQGSAANPLERRFLAASLAAQQAQRRLRVRRLRLTAAGLGTGLLVTAALALFALGQSDRLAGEVRVAAARELAAGAVANLDVDPERSILLALEAVESTRRSDGTVVREAEEALHMAMKRSRLVRTVPQGGSGLAVSSDGARFVTTGSDPRDNTATVWDTDTGAEVLELVGPDVGRATAVFSPDDRHIATTHDDGTVRLWDSATGEEALIMRGHEGEVGRAAYSPDGRKLVTAGEDHTVRVWDVTTGEEVLKLSGFRQPLNSPTFSADGTRLAVSSGLDVGLFDTETGELTGSLVGHDWPVSWTAFGPEDTHVATASGSTVRLWEDEAEPPMRTLASPARVDVVAFSPDGSRLATGGHDGIARIWDVHSGDELLALSGHTGYVANVAFTPDGDGLFTSASDDVTRLWDIGVGGARDWLTVPAATDIYTRVAFSPDGTSFAAPVDPSGVTVWDTRTGAEITTLTGTEQKLTDVAFSPDGRRVVAGSDMTLAPPVWDVETGDLLVELAGHTAGPRAVAFSPHGRRIATGSQDGTARVWDPDTGGELARIETGGGDVLEVGWSPDGRFLVTGGGNGETVVWDADTLERVHVLRGHQRAVEGIAFGADGTLVTSSADATARVWDLESGTGRTTLLGHHAVISGVAVSPDGTRIATSSDDGTTRLWDPTTGRELLTLVGHSQLVFDVTFSPDGRLLATASPDGTVALHLLPVDELVDLARERVTRELTDDECRRYLQRQACSAPPGDGHRR